MVLHITSSKPVKYVLIIISIALITVLSYSHEFNYYQSQNQLTNTSDEDSTIILKVDSLRILAEDAFYSNNYFEGKALIMDALKFLPDNNQPVNFIFARCFNVLGVIYDAGYSQFQDAINAYKNASEILSNISPPNQPFLASVYSNIGIIYRKLGDHSKAESYFISAINIFELFRNETSSLGYLGLTYSNYGHNSVDQKKYVEALELYFKSLEIRKSLESADWKIFHNIADCYFELKDYDEAGNWYKKAFQDFFQKESPDTLGPANLNLGYGDFLLKTGRLDEALPYIEKSYKLFKNQFGNKHRFTSMSLEELGDYYLNFDINEALDYYQKSIISTVNNFDNPDIYSNPHLTDVISKGQLISCLKSKAQAVDLLYKSDGKIDDLILSFETRELLVRIINEIRIGFQYEESKLLLSEEEAESFNKIVDNAYELYAQYDSDFYKNKVFEYAEKEKAAIFQSSLRETEAISLDIPQELQDKESIIKKELTEINTKINNARNSSSIDSSLLASLQNTRFDLNESKDSLTNIFEADYPEYYNFKYNTEVIRVESIQKILKSDECLLEYVIADSILYSLFVDKKQFLIKKQLSNNFKSTIDTLRGIMNLQYSGTEEEEFNSFKKNSYYLYDLLIKPFKSHIGKKDIKVIRDGDLAYLPFSILISKLEETKRINYSNLPYLLYTNNLSYSYSSTLLFNEFSEKEKPEKEIIAFAPSYDNTDNVLENSSIYRNINLRSLSQNENEIRSIQEITKADIFIKNEASEENFKNNAENYSIIHLATHSIIDSLDHNFSGLVFTNNNDSTENGLLNLSELYNLKLNAKLAVLSACNTGSGKQISGEGVLNLARGFIYAGCPGVVMTLWTVDDVSGTKIMSNFYAQLKNNKNKDEALRLAQLEYLESSYIAGTHPHYWAAYINVGDSSPVFTKKNIWLFILISGLGLIVILLVIRESIFKKKSE